MSNQLQDKPPESALVDGLDTVWSTLLESQFNIIVSMHQACVKDAAAAAMMLHMDIDDARKFAQIPHNDLTSLISGNHWFIQLPTTNIAGRSAKFVDFVAHVAANKISPAIMDFEMARISVSPKPKGIS